MTIGNRSAPRYGSLGDHHRCCRYLRVEPARLRRFVYEIDPSLLEDIERIDAALTEYAQSILERAKQVRPMSELRDPLTMVASRWPT